VPNPSRTTVHPSPDARPGAVDLPLIPGA
jgi:hypothetical protein